MLTSLPCELDSVGRAFFDRFSPLVAIEDERYLPAFCLLCRTWSEIQKVQTDPEIDKTGTLKLLGLMKYFTTAGKGFGLDPISAKKLVTEEEPQKDEFGL